jgi:hypothetical protein
MMVLLAALLLPLAPHRPSLAPRAQIRPLRTAA